MHGSVLNPHMHTFRPAKIWAANQLGCPQQLVRDDRGVHVSQQRAVVCCSQITIVPPNGVAWPLRQGVVGK
jgi:hypothetical protein